MLNELRSGVRGRAEMPWEHRFVWLFDQRKWDWVEPVYKNKVHAPRGESRRSASSDFKNLGFFPCGVRKVTQPPPSPSEFSSCRANCRWSPHNNYGYINPPTPPLLESIIPLTRLNSQCPLSVTSISNAPHRLYYPYIKYTPEVTIL